MKAAIAVDEDKNVANLKKAKGYLIYDIEQKKVTGKHYIQPKKAKTDVEGVCEHITGCKVIIISDIPKDIYESLICKNIVPVECEEKDPEEAIKIFLSSNLADE